MLALEGTIDWLAKEQRVGLFKTLGKAFFQSLGYYPARLQGRKFKVDPYHIGFWRLVSAGAWEPQTYNILSRFLNSDSVYYDLGAWIGPTAIFAAGLSKRVVCFEPDPVAFQYLLWNLRLNKLDNVLPMNLALADRNGLLRMASFGDAPGDSSTSLLKTKATGGTVEVLALTWQRWMEMAAPETPAFLKIDIEGGEFSLLPTMAGYLASHKPTVYLSTHAPYLNADQRREEMAKIKEVMQVYKTCLNENLEPVEMGELISDNALEQFRSFVFLD